MVTAEPLASEVLSSAPPAQTLLGAAPPGSVASGTTGPGPQAGQANGDSGNSAKAASESVGPDGRRKKPRLDHVDAMRPVKQAGVVSTHSLLAFAPGAAITVGGALVLLHVTREGFLFISACMLTYGYQDLDRIGYRYFYRRRAIAVALPYFCWTVIYFFLSMPGKSLTPLSGVQHFFFILGTGYYQLYYLVVIMQFYLLFPALFWLVRKMSDHHWTLIVVSFMLQVLITGMQHWGVFPSKMRGFWATREIIEYQFYLISGVVVALHLTEVHGWLCRNGWKIFGATVVAAAVAEAWFAASHDHIVRWFGSGSDPLQPIVIPFNIGAIACLYLLGVWLVAPERSHYIRLMTRSGSDNSYTIYLAQMIFIIGLEDLAWKSLNHVIPWPLVAAIGVAVVLLSCILLGSILARTHLSVALTGRERQSWRTWLPEDVRRTNGLGPSEAADDGSACVSEPSTEFART